DEERDLPDCIASLQGFCDEILVVDGGSRDRTREIAASLGARVLDRTFDDFARQHEFARVEARGEWVLSIDADERASPELRRAPFGGAAAYAPPFRNPFRRLGFLDGAPGAAMAWARAYEAFRRYARLWELSRFS